MPKKVTIIGAGPGGYVAAARAAQLGAEVTVIEEDHVGGTCLNWGCIPSKVMIHTAELLERFKKAGQFGILVEGEARVELQNLMSRKRQVIEIQREGILKLFKHHRIRYLRGAGRINGPGMATVKIEDGKTQVVPWDKLILATGSQPLALETFPFDHERILDSNDAISPNEIPESLLIVGGGVIGCEFAFVYSSLGSRVTVVEALSRVLPLQSVDADMSKVIQREMKKRKISFMVDSVVEKVEPLKDKIRITVGPFSSGSETNGKELKKTLTVEADKVLVCIGREPKTTHLGLVESGIGQDSGWVQVNDRMETSVPHIYAIGDMLGPSRPMLAHMASAEGLVAAENAMGGNQTISYDAVPGVVFTSPEVACVGMTEAQAMEAGNKKVRSESVLFRNLGKAQIIGRIEGQAKIIWDDASEKILGVHMVGPQVSDLIAESALVIRKGLSIKDLADTIHAHPTLAEILAEGVHKVLGEPMHG